MFEENENLVEEETTENAEEQTAEEIVEDNGEVEEETQETVENTEEEVKEEPQERLYTKEEVDSIKSRTKRRIEDKVRREYEKKYGRAETVLKAGLQKDNFEEAVDELENYYTQEGVRIPEFKYSQRDTEILANAEADEIIESGYDDIVEEVDRLANVGVDNMSDGEKIVFSKLAKERVRIEEEKDLSSIGISKESLPEDFKEFCKKLNPDMPIKEKYEFYIQTRPKKEVRKMGSMESGPTSKVKDHYTEAEIALLTDEDLDNPQIWNAVRKSMTGQ